MRISYHHYLVHVALQWFASALFNTFGALLYYELTGSIFGALAFYLFFHGALVVVRSLGVPVLFWGMRKIGMRNVMLLGLVLVAASYLVLPAIQSFGHLYPLLFLFALAHGIGTTLYWTPSNAVFFGFVGASSAPGHYTAYASIVRAVSGILAIVIGVALSFSPENFLLLFPIAGAFLLASVIPILHVAAPTSIENASFTKCLKRLSPLAFFANLDVGATLITVALPLILLEFGSFENSIWVVALTAVIAMLSTYTSGFLKDHKSNALLLVALIVLIGAWIGYGLASTVSQFAALGALYGTVAIIVVTCRDARLGREAVNSHEPLEATVAIEFARGLGVFIGSLILIVAYVLFGSLPQALMMLGALFIIPKGIYALGAIPRRQ